MAVTAQKIAELAGVSRGTVDRALHNRGRVNPEVAARIRKIADELGYKPNIVGQVQAGRADWCYPAVNRDTDHADRAGRYPSCCGRAACIRL